MKRIAFLLVVLLFIQPIKAKPCGDNYFFAKKSRQKAFKVVKNGFWYTGMGALVVGCSKIIYDLAEVRWNERGEYREAWVTRGDGYYRKSSIENVYKYEEPKAIGLYTCAAGIASLLSCLGVKIFQDYYDYQAILDNTLDEQYPMLKVINQGGIVTVDFVRQEYAGKKNFPLVEYVNKTNNSIDAMKRIVSTCGRNAKISQKVLPVLSALENIVKDIVVTSEFTVEKVEHAKVQAELAKARAMEAQGYHHSRW